MSVKRGELIVGHIPRELSRSRHGGGGGGGGGDRRVTGEIFRDSNGFAMAFPTALSG